MAVNFLNKITGKKKTTGVGMIKNNVLMIGPTGVGKTYMIKLIAQYLLTPAKKKLNSPLTDTE